VNSKNIFIETEILRAIPKAELHVHLRGSMTPAFFKSRVKKYDINDIFQLKFNDLQKKMLWQTDKIRSYLLGESTAESLFDFTSFNDFLKTYFFTGAFFQEISDIEELAYSACDELVNQGVTYVEFTFSLNEYLEMGHNINQVFEALNSISLNYSNKGIVVNWIIDLVRNFGHNTCDRLLDLIIEKRFPSLVGINLGGNEVDFPPEGFTAIFKKAKDAGLKTTIHSGEGLGAESVKYVVENIRPDRIGHGVRASESLEVMSKLKKSNIPLEICVSSNLALGIYGALKDHPIKKMYDYGIPVTVSTDDPGFFGCSLIGEIGILHKVGISQLDQIKILRQSFVASFADEKTKSSLLAQFDSYVGKLNI
jgi:adenosine deaminase